MSENLHPPVSAADHVRGDAVGAPEITVFGDYECPDSGRLWRVLQDARAEGQPFREVFRHFPLTRVHPHALTAAQAAEAAGDQGTFWEMHDLLFEHQDALELSDFAAYAAELGLDIERLDEDLAYESFKDAVSEDQRSGVSSRVTTTPAVFFNGQRLALTEPEHLRTVLGGPDQAAVSDA